MVCALVSACCYGVASAMQAVAARATATVGTGVDPRLLIRLLRQWRYVCGVGFDLLGFVAQATALRSLPLFVVQAAQAAGIAVTAVLAARWFRLRLSRTEWTSVGAVCVGLALLGTAATGQAAGHGPPAFQYALLAAAVFLGALGVAAGRLPDPARSVTLGLAAGLLFGTVGMAVRVLPTLALGTLVRDPATYAAVLAGILGSWFYAAALQRGNVVAATATAVIGETVPPAVIGLLLLGDHARPGWLPVAAAGFAVAVAGALALARFGELDTSEEAPPVVGAHVDR
jgi:drug/metabolite transporter (DMT)-like permease